MEQHGGHMADLPQHLSPSSASAFEGCPRRWRFKYIERQPEPSGQAALVGSFAHLVLELLCEFPAVERTMDKAKALAKQAWPEFEVDQDYESLELSEGEARAFRWQAWLAIGGLWDIEDPATVEVVSTEQKVAVDLGPVPFVGIIDRVDRMAGKLVVSDYKSGTLPGVRWREDKLQQVMLYAAALQASEGELPDRARLLYLGQRILDVRVTERRVEDAVGSLSEVWDNVATACSTDQFDPKPTVLCGWCPFIEQCPEGRAELQKRHDAGSLPAHAPAAVLVA
jgi:putative RecB family exonuclease